MVTLWDFAVDESLSVTNQIKAIELYSPVKMFIMYTVQGFVN